MDRSDDLFVLLRAGDGQHVGESVADDFGLVAHAAGDNYPSVLGDGFTNRLEAFFLGGIEESARVDQHDVGAGIIGRHLIAFGAQLG